MPNIDGPLVQNSFTEAVYQGLVENLPSFIAKMINQPMSASSLHFKRS